MIFWLIWSLGWSASKPRITMRLRTSPTLSFHYWFHTCWLGTLICCNFRILGCLLIWFFILRQSFIPAQNLKLLSHSFESIVRWFINWVWLRLFHYILIQLWGSFLSFKLFLHSSRFSNILWIILWSSGALTSITQLIPMGCLYLFTVLHSLHMLPTILSTTWFSWLLSWVITICMSGLWNWF